VLSLGLGWSFARTGRVISAIVMHAGFNAGNLLLAAL
jgi:membrane protease YdiL (CAAX protease family)